MNIIDWLKRLFEQPELMSPFVSELPNPTPIPEPRRLALENYPTAEGQIPDQPNDEMAKIIWDVFGPRNEATQSAAAAWAENASEPYNPLGYGWNAGESDQPYPNSPRGTEDLGVWQINSGEPQYPEMGYISTLTDLLSRRGGQLEDVGVRGQQDLYDTLKNALMAKIIREEEDQVGSEPWGRWYGWKNKGMELNK